MEDGGERYNRVEGAIPRTVREGGGERERGIEDGWREGEGERGEM